MTLNYVIVVDWRHVDFLQGEARQINRRRKEDGLNRQKRWTIEK